MPAALAEIAPASHPAADRAPEWVAGGTPQPLRGELEALLKRAQALKGEWRSGAHPALLM